MKAFGDIHGHGQRAVACAATVFKHLKRQAVLAEFEQIGIAPYLGVKVRKPEPYGGHYFHAYVVGKFFKSGPRAVKQILFQTVMRHFTRVYLVEKLEGLRIAPSELVGKSGKISVGVAAQYHTARVIGKPVPVGRRKSRYLFGQYGRNVVQRLFYKTVYAFGGKVVIGGIDAATVFCKLQIGTVYKPARVHVVRIDVYGIARVKTDTCKRAVVLARYIYGQSVPNGKTVTRNKRNEIFRVLINASDTELARHGKQIRLYSGFTHFGPPKGNSAV